MSGAVPQNTVNVGAERKQYSVRIRAQGGDQRGEDADGPVAPFAHRLHSARTVSNDSGKNMTNSRSPVSACSSSLTFEPAEAAQALSRNFSVTPDCKQQRE